MLLALVFRGVAFEFRYQDREHRAVLGPRLLLRLGCRDFCAGHGARRLHPGLRGRRTAVRRRLLDCFTLFSVFTGFALMFGYGLLGAGWLVIKTEGDLQDWARAGRALCLIGVAASRSWSSACGRR